MMKFLSDTGEHYTLVDCNEGADLLRNNETGGYFWHAYDPEVDPSGGDYSSEYPTESEARRAWEHFNASRCL